MQTYRLILVALTAGTLVSGCGGGSGGSGLPVGTPGPLDVCAEAFASARERGLLERLTATDPAPVPLSSCTFDVDRSVTIGSGGCGPRVVIDRSFTGADALGHITIAADGSLVTPLAFAPIEIATRGIAISGLLGIGTDQCPVGGEDANERVTITFTGARPADPSSTDGADKGIDLRPGGTLRLIGAKGRLDGGVSWTRLAAPAGPAAYQTASAGIGVPVEAGGERVLHLARDVTVGPGAWRAGDWIVVATTSFSPFQSEFVQIDSASADGNGGSIVNLEQPLRHYHFGGADPGLPGSVNFSAGADTNYGVDERAEVGLVSRSIVLTTPASDDADPSTRHWGGEIRLLPGFAGVTMQGVEIEKFGKDRLGSYPLHFHMTGDVSGKSTIEANSIHHSYNKCVTLHSTSGAVVRDTVCARAVGHLFYQEIGDEQQASFIGNLGIGAMSHYFGIDADAVPKTDDGKVRDWWEGDHLAALNGYDGLNVKNADAQSNPTHGRCFVPDANLPGRLRFAQEVPCGEGQLYVEQASGFWIVNPGTVLEGNSIAGCQGMGKGYWYVPPADTLSNLYPQRFIPLGSFLNNRVHGCYDGLFGETDVAAVSQQLFPTVDGKSTAELDAVNLIAHFKGFTATRIRNRGVWMRPMWTAVEDGRFATNRDSVSLVSSGGNDGNGPGVWALLKDSVLVGVSRNNVERWGPCPRPDLGDGPGCVDVNPNANELFEHGYQTPRWNSAGYMIYDGPVRILHDRFVNYLRDPTPLLTQEDRNVLARFVAWPNPAAKQYEGDAALGWFQNNQSAYPTATVNKELVFDNVDLRHQIYTEKVNLGDFRDGDKNTALIDLDGTLTGYRVVGPDGAKVDGAFPISLNNLPFNHTSNAVDECHATGTQDEFFEGRATSLISPASTATLEFEAQYPNPGGATWQDMRFTRDDIAAGAHQSMVLTSRNAQGIWEPKVASGHGYTVRAETSTAPAAPQPPASPGIPSVVRVGFTDAAKPGMDTKPFFVRLGICYSDANGNPPANRFTITRGFKSWGGNGVSYNNPALQQHFNFLANRYKGQSCFNLDHQNPQNLDPASGCPADGVTAVPPSGACPAPSTKDDSVAPPVCVYPRSTLSAASSLVELTNSDGTPASLDKYYYDAATGMLFFYVVQPYRNAAGVAPLGSCPGDPACPGDAELDTFYSCPPQGCANYSVRLDDPTYVPGPSRCDERAGGSIYADGRFVLPQPTDANRLVYVVPQGVNVPGVVDGQSVLAQQGVTPQGELQWTAQQAPWCDVTSSIVASSPRASQRKRSLGASSAARSALSAALPMAGAICTSR